MASSSSSLPQSTAKKSSQHRSAEEFIEQQLRKTRWQVKLTDLISSLMTLAAGLLGYLLLLAVVDHWLFGLNFWGRSLALALLLLGVAWYCVTRVGPLLWQGINPLFAARVIEQSQPSVKNSLINFLMFRTHRGEVNELVYRALETRAATDLTRVPVETAVDRSQVIHIGYVLAALLAIGGLYTILSPKDPFQTVSRVAAPWADISRPSRVKILDVQPGNVTVFRGEPVSVVADVQGIRPADTLQVVYSTEDGELVEQEVAMQLEPSGLRCRANLPPGDAGVQQNLHYRVQAGDAASPRYRVTMSPAPAIVVESVQYDYPDYTGKADETIDDEGDIRGLEGTRVTIRARANQPIGSARIHFDPDLAESSKDAGQQVKPMEFKNQAAWYSFYLELKGDRRTPTHQGYQLEFVTADGHESRHPVLHNISVTPDMGPEIEVLTPTRSRIEVPVDGTQRIEMRSLDPDFGLRRVTLRAVSGGTDIVRQPLFEHAPGQAGQVVVNYDFRPGTLGLAAGDQVSFWGIAEDNRQAIRQGGPAPNTERTNQYQLLIVASKSASPRDKKGETSEEKDGRAQEDPQGAEEAEQETSHDSSNSGESQAKSSEQAGSSSDAAEKGESEQAGTADGGPQGDQQQAGEQQSGEGGQAQSQGGAAAGGQTGRQSPEGQTSGGESSAPSDSAGGEPSGSADREPLHDGEVFERVLERMQRQQGENGGKGGEARPDEQPSGEPTTDGSSPGAREGQHESNSQQRDGGNQAGEPSSGTPEREPPSGEPRGNERRGVQESGRDQGAGSSQQAESGEGGESRGSRPDSGQAERRSEKQSADPTKKEPGQGDSGQSGAGQDTRETTGSGTAETGQDQSIENRDRRKEQTPQEGSPQDTGASDVSTNRRQSDSQGGSSGDRSGGGQKGGGQGAQQPGNDSAGSHNSADEGAGAAQELGAGETSDSAGQGETADGPTGSSSNQQGSGSRSRQDPGGQQGSTESKPAQPDPGQSPPKEPSTEQTGGGSSEGGSGVPSGGGVPSDNGSRANLDNLEVPEGDDANLEYARRATDMVLDRLKDQTERPDKGLLDELGWSEDDLRRFVDKWQRLRDAARQDPTGKRELDETLRSLGLQPSRDRVRAAGGRDDQVRGLSESADDSGPPPQYQRQFDAFRKGAAADSAR